MAAMKFVANRNAEITKKAIEAGDFGFAAVIFSAEFLGNGESEDEAAEIWETWLPDLKEERQEVFGYICW